MAVLCGTLTFHLLVLLFLLMPPDTDYDQPYCQVIGHASMPLAMLSGRQPHCHAVRLIGHATGHTVKPLVVLSGHYCSNHGGQMENDEVILKKAQRTRKPHISVGLDLDIESIQAGWIFIVFNVVFTSF